MKKIILLLVMTFLMAPVSSFADPFDAAVIVEVLNEIFSVNKEISNYSEQIKNFNADIVSGLTGLHNYGANYYDPNLFLWGNKLTNWQDVIDAAKNGHADGEMGNAIRDLAKQFPVAKDNLGDNDLQNNYYLLQAQTNLAARASSQVTFEKLNKEAETLKQLHQLIDQAQDNKSAVDLSNRLATEQSNISIQQAKLLAVLVEQAAIANQEKTNHIKENEDFFDIK